SNSLLPPEDHRNPRKGTGLVAPHLRAAIEPVPPATVRPLAFGYPPSPGHSEEAQMKKNLLVLSMAVGFAASAQAADVKVLNADAWFPEGPIWYHDKLFYVEYGRNTVMTWDGQKNEVFWKQDGCGPSAVLPTTAGDFVVTCYDSNSIGRIS